MEILRTACNRDCPDVCTIEVHRDASGRGVKLRGAGDDPVTRGFLCERTSRFLQRQYSPDRFLTPMWRPRRGESLRPIGWEDALDLAAEKLARIRDESGGASVLHYRSGGAMGMLKRISDYLFELFGPVTIKRGDICSGAGETAQEVDFGICESHDIFDVHNSRSVIVWGKNLHTSSPHLLPILLEAARRGTRLVGLDVNRTRLATVVDDFHQIAPASDFELAMAVALRLRERGWLDPRAREYCDHYDEFWTMVEARSWTADEETVESLARALGQDRPCNVQIGWGLTRRRWGAASVRAIDALVAVTGNLGVAGGGSSYYYRRRSAFDVSFFPGKVARTFSESLLGREILDACEPRVRAIWVTAGNPLSMLPDSDTVRRAFASAEFVVVPETHPTDTTEMADLVLPVLTLLEDDDLLGAYGNHYLRESRPALDPSGEARHELWVWQEMARRWGFGEALAGTPTDWKRRMLEGSGVSLEALGRGPVRNPAAEPVLFADRLFPTPSGKVNLIHAAPPSLAADPSFPWTLLAISTPKAQASQWSVAPEDPPLSRIHPSTAGEFRDGELARLESARASLAVRVRLDDTVHPRAVFMAKGGMTRNGGCPNLLIGAEETDLGGGACFYDEPVRLVKA